MSLSTDQGHGYTHNMMAGISKESTEALKTLPGLMHSMLREEGWRVLIRPIDGKRFTNDSLEEWILGPPWRGLSFPDWATLYALLDQNIEHGEACLDLLEQAGAPSRTKVDGNHLGERARAQGAVLTPAEAGAQGGRGHKASNNITSFRGTNPTYIMRRLLKNRPDLFERVQQGKLSANAAAIEAGFRKVRTPLEQLQHWWQKASVEERARFLSELGAP